MSKPKSRIVVISSLDNLAKENFKPISTLVPIHGINIVNITMIDANIYYLAYKLKRA